MIGNITSIEDALGNTTSYSYDAFGNPLTKTGPDGVTTSYSYDTENQLISSTIGTRTFQYTYDGVGNLKETVRPGDALIKTYDYDGAGRLIGTEDYDGSEAERTYSWDFTSYETTNPLGGRAYYTYDSENRLIDESTPSYGSVSYEYDASGLLASLTNARGQQRSFTYDAAGRLTDFSDDDGETSYAYDADGNITNASDYYGYLTRSYDTLGRVISATDTWGEITEYAYDEKGNLTTLTYPDGRQVLYTYNALNQMTSVTDWNARVTSYTYDASGRLATTVRPDGSVLENTYNQYGELIGTSDYSANYSDYTMEQEYSFDAQGNISGEYLYGFAWSWDSGTVYSFDTFASYDYDVSQRVEWASKYSSIGTSFSYSDEFFGYDQSGNIVHADTYSSSAPSTPGQWLEYDSQNRLIYLNGDQVSYDADGNMISAPFAAGNMTFSYDSKNRLMSAGDTEYYYDTFGNRTEKYDTNGWTYYTYDAQGDSSNLLVEYGPEDTTYYIYGMGLIASESSDGTYNTYHYDLRGSTIALSDEYGYITDHFEYSAYGELVLHEGTSTTPFLFNGQYGVITDDNGLIYMRARYYSPELKRFVNADILKGDLSDLITLNRYAFANGNPISFIDPFGLSATLSNVGHTALDFLGLIPGVGAAFDIINGIWYAAEGDYVNAGLSAAGAIPLFGDAIAATRLGLKTVNVVSGMVVAGKRVDGVGGVARATAKGADYKFPKDDKGIEKVFGIDHRTYHKEVKPEIKKQVKSSPEYGKAYKGMGENPDIGIDSGGNIVLKDIESKKTLPTDWPFEDFLP